MRCLVFLCCIFCTWLALLEPKDRVQRDLGDGRSKYQKRFYNRNFGGYPDFGVACKIHLRVTESCLGRAPNQSPYTEGTSCDVITRKQ